jgi:hypothetical protein
MAALSKPAFVMPLFHETLMTTVPPPVAVTSPSTQTAHIPVAGGAIEKTFVAAIEAPVGLALITTGESKYAILLVRPSPLFERPKTRVSGEPNRGELVHPVRECEGLYALPSHKEVPNHREKVIEGNAGTPGKEAHGPNVPSEPALALSFGADILGRLGNLIVKRVLELSLKLEFNFLDLCLSSQYLLRWNLKSSHNFCKCVSN